MDLPEDEIRELLACIARRQPKALAERAIATLYLAFQLRLRRFVQRRLRDPNLVGEIVQDTMLAVWKEPERYRGTASFRAYVFAIARFKTIDANRGSARDDVLDAGEWEAMAADLPDLGEYVHGEQIRAAVRHCCESQHARGRLSDEQVDVLHLAYVEDMSLAEIAVIVDCPVNTVKTRLYHARLIIKHCLEQRLQRGEP